MKFIKVLTNEGYITLNRMTIVAIDPKDEGTQIVIIPEPYSEEPIVIDSVDPYEQVLEKYFTGN
jgi:hypothetical protein